MIIKSKGSFLCVLQLKGLQSLVNLKKLSRLGLNQILMNPHHGLRECHEVNYGKDAPGIGLDGTATTASMKMTPRSPLTNTENVTKYDPRAKVASRYVSRKVPVMKVIQEDGKRSPEILLEDDGEEVLTNPYKAAVASGVSFLIGSCVPLLSAVLVAQNVVRILVMAVVASIALAFFGGFGSYLGGSPIRISAVGILLGGWIAMAITFGLLKPFDKDHS
uniref:Vacuolar iron transporter n=1 Tax=Populus davidiana TaxID=266767 RepID=A0A6M2FAW9_9ROSI